MKKIIVEVALSLVIGLFISPAYGSNWTGHLYTDLTVIPCAGYAFVAKELDSGVCKPIWHLDQDAKERFHLGYAQLWDVHHGNPAYMGTLGFKFGSLGTVVEFVNSNLFDLPNWMLKVKNVGDYVTIEGMGGYRPVRHLWDGAIGGYLHIPIGPEVKAAP